MVSINRFGFLALVFAIGVGISPAAAFAADSRITLVATVTDGYQLVGEDGQPYEVENTAKGNDLVVNHIGRKVEVVGTVVDEVDYKVIAVDAFRVLED